MHPKGGSRDPSPAGYASPYRKEGGLRGGRPVLIQVTLSGSAVWCALKIIGIATAVVPSVLPFDPATVWAGAASILHLGSLPTPSTSSVIIAAVLVAVLAAVAHVSRLGVRPRRDETTPLCPASGGSVKTVAVIGAGPSGLVAAKFLLERGYDVRIFESEDNIGVRDSATALFDTWCCLLHFCGRACHHAPVQPLVGIAHG